MRLVTRVFQILAQYHLSYACSAKPDSLLSPVAHVFHIDATISPGTQIHFAGVCFSPKRHKITLVDLPSRVLVEIATVAESYFTGFIVNDRASVTSGSNMPVRASAGLSIAPCDQGLLVIRRNAVAGTRTTCDELLVTIQGILTGAGFVLVDTLQVGKPLALQRRRELQLYRCIGPLAPGYA
jgi:hypothetical protein